MAAKTIFAELRPEVLAALNQEIARSEAEAFDVEAYPRPDGTVGSVLFHPARSGRPAR